MVETTQRKLGTLLVLAGLFIGLGMGIGMNKVAPGVLIGLGVGFLAAYLSVVLQKK